MYSYQKAFNVFIMFSYIFEGNGYHALFGLSFCSGLYPGRRGYLVGSRGSTRGSTLFIAAMFSHIIARKNCNKYRIPSIKQLGI